MGAGAWTSIGARGTRAAGSTGAGLGIDTGTCTGIGVVVAV